MDNWTLAFDKGNYTNVFYINFYKVFVIVPRKKLISKLESLNIRKEIINRIEAFLTDRKQKVAVNGKRIKMARSDFWITSGFGFRTITIDVILYK